MFHISKKLKPAGDQPQAIQALTSGFSQKKMRKQTLLGVTGSGKTFTMAHTIQKLGAPTLVISHNKTLAAQLYEEFRVLFPRDRVGYFVSYYDYYQPEAYMPSTDVYIEKEVKINEEIDRMRHASVLSLLSHDNSIVVASVSCIYNLGNPQIYNDMAVNIKKGTAITRRELLKTLFALQYERNEIGFWRGNFRLRDQSVDVWPPDGDTIVRIVLEHNHITSISLMEAPYGKSTDTSSVILFPAKFWPSEENMRGQALDSIKRDLKIRVAELKKKKKFVEAERLDRRTKYDIAMIEEVGWCHGIENYSRYFENRAPGSPPFTLLDYFSLGTTSTPRDFLTIIDESHMTIPQIRGMWHSDRARKKALIEHGFRLPSALDNRPLTFGEFNNRVGHTLYASATPSEYEKRASQQIVEQVVRPTHLLDPTINVRGTKNQIPDLIEEINARIKRKERVLVTVLTKRLAETLAQHLKDHHIKAEYLHSEIDTLERPKLLRDLREGKFDVLVGINLLREGLDLPEVSLVAILDADKEGFLRDKTSFIQISGRASRHLKGTVIMYADHITGSMRSAISEMKRRRTIQQQYNRYHHTRPRPIVKQILYSLKEEEKEKFDVTNIRDEFKRDYIKELQRRLDLAQRNLQFEKASHIKGQLIALKQSQKNKKRNK